MPLCALSRTCSNLLFDSALRSQTSDEPRELKNKKRDGFFHPFFIGLTIAGYGYLALPGIDPAGSTENSVRLSPSRVNTTMKGTTWFGLTLALMSLSPNRF